MMTSATAVTINCICSVLTIIITLFSISAKFFKNSLTKSDLKPIHDKLNDLEEKIDRQEHAQSDMRERLAIVEFQLGITHGQKEGSTL